MMDSVRVIDSMVKAITTLGVVLALYSSPIFATITFEGDDGVKQIIEVDGGCTGCHGTFDATPAVACTGSEDMDLLAPYWYPSFSGTDTDKYNAANNCRATIQKRVNFSSFVNPVSGDPYVYMPQSSACDPFNEDPIVAGADTSGCLTVAHKNLVTGWDGTRWMEPEVTSSAATSVSNTSATFNASVLINGALLSEAYFKYSTDSAQTCRSDGTCTGTKAYDASLPTETGGGTTSYPISSTVSNLACGTKYYYRAYASNAQGLSMFPGGNQEPVTDACSAPVINVNGTPSAGPLAFNLSKGQSLTNVDFKITATDADYTNTLDWDISSGPGAATNGIASTSSTNTANPSITYTAPADVPVPATVSFTVRVRDETVKTDTAEGLNPTAQLSDTITINVTIVDNAPTIDQTTPLDFLISEDSISNALQLTATDADGDPLTWTTPIPPTGGYSGAVDVSDDTKFNITYTPVPNADTANADTFTVRVSDGTGFDEIVVSVDIVPATDNPVANDDPDYEVLVNSSGNILDVLDNDTDVDTGDTKTLAAQTITGSNGGTITVNSPGTANNTLSYTPATNAVVAETFTYTVTDSDNLTDTALVTVSPPDTDGDGVVDFIDNCAATDNGPLEGTDNQADNDGDQVINVNTTSDPADPLVGGDACDTDDDNDGMPDAFEIANGFDKNNAADAALDEDGDGVSNLQEFLDGTDPTLDSVGPSVTAPVDVTVNATGYLTKVDIGKATASDGNDGVITAIFPVVDAPISNCSELKNFPAVPKPFRPGSHTVTWATCDAAGNLAIDTQTVNVRPLVSTTSGLIISEGQVASVNVFLNGEAATYPVTVDYGLGGSTATVIDDHDAISGSITIADPDVDGNSPGRVGRLNINIANDVLAEPDETIVVTLLNAINAALGSSKVNTVTITDSNVAPTVDIHVDQNGVAVGPKFEVGGGATDLSIAANAFDANGDTLTYDWSATDNALTALATVSGSDFGISAASLNSVATGLYTVSVSVSDGTLVTTRDKLLVAHGGIVTVLPVGIDTDGDGIDDDDPLEGFGDSDEDGIPNYLDNAFSSPNAIENQTGSLSRSFMIETDAGLNIRKGTTALAAGATGILISQLQLETNGGQAGGIAVNAGDDHANTSGLYDFEISGLNPAVTSANVVIPLPAAIEPDSVYRKYNMIDGWFTFVEDGNNVVSSAPGELGVCPSPGSSEYTSGLTLLHYCVQLTIEDGGPNDADKIRNFVIKDPGGVAVEPEVAEKKASADGRIGVIHPLLLLIMLLPFAYAYRSQIRREFVRIKNKRKIK